MPTAALWYRFTRFLRPRALVPAYIGRGNGIGIVLSRHHVHVTKCRRLHQVCIDFDRLRARFMAEDVSGAVREFIRVLTEHTVERLDIRDSALGTSLALSNMMRKSARCRHSGIFPKAVVELNLIKIH